MKKEIQNEANIIIVDDSGNTRQNLKDILSEDGYRITVVENIALAREELNKGIYHLSMVDLKLPDGSGIELLKEIKKTNQDMMVIVFTGFASLESSVAALNEGAFAYIQKPLNMDEVRLTIKKALKMQQLTLDNKNLLSRLRDLSLKDPLTGLYNYRYLRERLDSEFKRAKRYVLPLSVIMLDIDYFKSINDVYGHQYGDIILKEFSQYLNGCIRKNDIVVRYGGEEFMVILPDTNKEGVILFAARLLDLLKEHIFDPKNNKIKLKTSLGIAVFPDDGIDTESAILDAADQALHSAKELGGNRLETVKDISREGIEHIVEEGEKENIDKLKEKLFKMENRINQTLLESIYAFAKTIEAKDYYTGEHVENMVSIVTSIGQKLNLHQREIEDLKHAAILHDLGKVAVPDSILRKRGALNKKEYERIKKHPHIGAEIIRCVHFLRSVVPIVLYHHERYDGLGYSAGLRGREIPLGARIISVADVYQALISDRPYRKAYSQKEAVEIIKEGSGTQFDPEVVNAFLETLSEDMDQTQIK